MEYYNPPAGTERMLRSRIRRCYTALAELQSTVEYLYNNTEFFNEHYVVEDAERMYEMYRQAARTLTGAGDLTALDEESGVQRAQELLLANPDTAMSISRSIEHVHDAAEGIIRNVEYQLDADHFDSSDKSYQAIRRQAISALGLTDIVLDAIDEGFIIDVNTYNEYGY